MGRLYRDLPDGYPDQDVYLPGAGQRWGELHRSKFAELSYNNGVPGQWRVVCLGRLYRVPNRYPDQDVYLSSAGQRWGELYRSKFAGLYCDAMLR